MSPTWSAAFESNLHPSLMAASSFAFLIQRRGILAFFTAVSMNAPCQTLSST